MFVFYINVNNLSMITPLIFISGIVVALYILAINKLMLNSLIKKRKFLNKNYGQKLFGGLFVLQNSEFTLSFLKNFYLMVLSKNFKFKIKLNIGSEFVRYYISKDYLRLYYVNFNITFYKNKFVFESADTVFINFIIEKPNCQFFINTKTNSFSLKEKSTLKFNATGFKDFNIVDKGNYLNIETQFNKSGRVTINQDFRILDKQQLVDFKKDNFGYYDTAKWEFMPVFKNNDFNLLQEKYQINLLNKSNKTITLLGFDYNESILDSLEFKIKDYKLFSLDKLGFSKLVLLRRAKNKLYVKDVLVNFEYVLLADKNVKAQILNLWGENYILLQSNNCNVKLSVFNKFVNNNFLFKPLTIGNNLPKINNFLSISNIFDNINRLLLHGVEIDIFKICANLNLKYLPEYVQFKVCNCFLTYINTFSKQYKINQYKLKKFFLKSLIYAIKNLNSNTFCFLKKILPYITEQKLSNKILDLILECRSKFKTGDYEYYVSEILGIRLEKNKLYMTPSKKYSTNATLWLKGKLLTLKINKDWQILKVDGLTLSGIDYFDLKNFDARIDLEYI